MKTPAILIIIGAVIILVGILWQLGVPFGKLPGDIRIEKSNFKFYFPITASIIISIILTIFFLLYKAFFLK